MLEKIASFSDEIACQPYSTDWTKIKGKAIAVYFPKNTQEVSQILKECSRNKIPVVPSGGRTGLSGGAVATPEGAVILSLEKMDRILSLDKLGKTLEVEAGVITQKVHDYCKEQDLLWPIDLAAKGSSQIGGNLSTNAGGVRVIRYGMARRWVLGLEVVLIDGTILNLNGALQKNNNGYDLVQLLIGSEGTLGVITKAILKLTTSPQRVSTLLYCCQDLQTIESVFAHFRRIENRILAFEFFASRCLAPEKMQKEWNGNYFVLIEIEGEVDEAVNSEIKGVNQVYLALSEKDRAYFWSLREGITEYLHKMGPPYKFDVSVPIDKEVAFLREVSELKEDPYLFGHFGDGSPHLNFLGIKNPQTLEATLFPIIKKYGGSLSAEHGVGLLRKGWMEYRYPPEHIELLRRIKHAFDPHNLLNPGKVIP